MEITSEGGLSCGSQNTALHLPACLLQTVGGGGHLLDDGSSSMARLPVVSEIFGKHDHASGGIAVRC